MTLQEWFDYLKAKADGKDDRNISVEEAFENTSIKSYYDNLQSDILKMAYEDKLLLYFGSPFGGPSIDNSEIPESLRKYHEQTNCSIVEIFNLCEKVLRNDESIGKVGLGPNFEYTCDIIVYSAKEKNLIDFINGSLSAISYIDDIKKRKNNNDMGFFLKNYYRSTVYNFGDCLVDTYNELVEKYFMYDVKEDILAIKKEKFKDWCAEAKLLGQEGKLGFFFDMADDIVEYLSKHPEGITLHRDGYIFNNYAIPMGLYLFSDDIEEVPYVNIELIEYAINRAGIQDNIEVTSDEEKITYKNKVFM